jgi:glutamate 5-kinase
MTTQYLVNAYRGLERASGRDRVTQELSDHLESAIADIQLFGAVGQIQLAKAFTESMNTTSRGDPRDLLARLRSDLRRELELAALSETPAAIVNWRFREFNAGDGR